MRFLSTSMKARLLSLLARFLMMVPALFAARALVAGGEAMADPGTDIPAIQKIIDYVDTTYELRSDMTAQARITTKDPEQGNKIIESILYRRDRDDAFLVVIASPETDRGNGYLRVGDNMWMYKRNTRTFTHIGRDEKIGGSNATAGDFESRKFGELYKPATDAQGRDKITAETLGSGNIPVYKVEVMAKVNDVKYPKLVMWITRDKYLELKRECYSLSGTLMETDFFTSYKEIDGRYVPLLQKFVDEIEKGRTSVLEITGISFSKVDDYKFDKAYLESLSK
ncbi:MAG: outer membrane lipoprotein-sorting protein [Spirochaetaceae bacterium]|nr:MAG: outer membrane lipoprotein-sorting protein [Spirochaetaceae bacterium]